MFRVRYRTIDCKGLSVIIEISLETTNISVSQLSHPKASSIHLGCEEFSSFRTGNLRVEFHKRETSAEKIYLDHICRDCSTSSLAYFVSKRHT